ncbi:hypothetical protein [Kitasatospora sp. NPDC004289]
MMIYHVIGIALLVIGTPLVALAGNLLAEYVHEGLGRTVTIGGGLAVTGTAIWFIVRSF